MKVLSLIFVLMLSIVTSSTTFAQEQKLFGVNVNSNIYPDQFKLNVGATFEIQFGKHNGGETGLYYRTDRTTDILSYTDATGSHSNFFTIARRYMTIPVLYKYNSHFVNFSAGPTVDFYLGWKQKGDEFPYQIKSYSMNPKVKVGFLTKVSKMIALNDRFILEPELRFSSVQTFDEANLGIGLAGKYRL